MGFAEREVDGKTIPRITDTGGSKHASPSPLTTDYKPSKHSKRSDGAKTSHPPLQTQPANGENGTQRLPSLKFFDPNDPLVLMGCCKTLTREVEAWRSS